MPDAGAMGLEELVGSARGLEPVPPAAAAAYAERGPALTAQVDAELCAHPELARLIGGNPVEVMQANHVHHAAFLASVFALGLPEPLARTVPWVYRAYRGHGFSYDYFPAELAAWMKAVERSLAPELARPILATYRWMVRHHPDFVALAEAGAGAPPPAPGEERWAGPRERYLAALLAGDSAAALAVAREVSEPGAIEGFLLSVVQPAMYAVGARWERGELSVAQEHLASAITSRVVVALDEVREPGRPWRGRALVTAAPNEYHQLGAWMLSDLLEADGWAVSYLGANTPEADLLQMVQSSQPDLLALSVTMPFNLERARSIVAGVRRLGLPRPPGVLVGGQAFGLDAGLWRAVGADAWAPDARQAVERARPFGRAAPGR